ncbi:MAG: hypothetical protein AAF215_08480 [Cyanobacteria bacterium P01_A01_bin.123]
MHDNKVRLSRDVLEKAELIAAEWGLKNARAAVEAVFRRYCEEYRYGREQFQPITHAPLPGIPVARPGHRVTHTNPPQCEALDALDQLLSL